MNIEKFLPYWHQGRRYVNRFELNIPRSSDIESWQHPNQQGDVSRPDGHEILRVLEAKHLDQVIGLATLLHFQQNPKLRPTNFQSIHMCGWLDVVYGPYGDRIFVPTLTPVSSGATIHWVDLNSGFNCIDAVPLRIKP